MAEFKTWLAGQYGFLTGRLITVLAGKPERWLKLREKCTSDTQAEREWARTAEGMNETAIRLQMKAMDKMASAISTRISVAQGEARNEY